MKCFNIFALIFLLKLNSIFGEELLSPLYSFTLQSPYIDDALGNRQWDFGGNALVEISRHIRLTRDAPSQNGWLWTKQPLNEQSYQIEFEYKISGQSDTISGDGMAFWLTKERADTGPVFGNRQFFHGLGVFFDTYPNSQHRYPFPYVMGMFGDGQKRYDPSTDGADTELAGCPADIRKKDYPTKCRIRYVKGQYVEVQLNTKEGGTMWTPCFRVNVTLPDNVFIGFTALTGALSDNHDVIKVTVNSISHSDVTVGEFIEKHGSDYNNGFSFSLGLNFHHIFYSILRMIFYSAILLVVAYIVYRVYSKQKKQSFKHF